MSKSKIDEEIPPPPPVPVIDELAPSSPPDAKQAKQPIEHWQIVAGTPKWLWAGMKLGKGWPIGKEVTRAEYDEAVNWAANVECR